MKKVLVIADVENWAFDTIYRNLKLHCKNYQIEVWYEFSKNKQLHNIDSYKEFDIIFYLNDYSPEFLLTNKIPKEKVILAIRSNVTHDLYNGTLKNNILLNSICGMILVSNKSLESRFKQIHGNVHIWSGGVDTKLFRYTEKKIGKCPIVGWAGSKNNFGSSYRGLNLIESACNKLGFKWEPALREDKWRTPEEMYDYYSTKIDIYVDASMGAGRQNGIYEAASTGRAIVASRVGIAEQLIAHGVNGELVDRTVESICIGLQNAVKNYERYGKLISNLIKTEYSWEVEALKFEKYLNNIKGING